MVKLWLRMGDKSFILLHYLEVLDYVIIILNNLGLPSRLMQLTFTNDMNNLTCYANPPESNLSEEGWAVNGED